MFLSKNLYNTCLFEERQLFFEKGIIKFTDVNCTFKIPEYVDPNSKQQVATNKTPNRIIKVLIIQFLKLL